MLINKSTLGALFTGYKASFQRGFQSREDALAWRQIATLVPSMTAQEQYQWLGQFPNLREWVGDRVIKQMKAHAYTLRNRKFESTIAVGRDDIEDDQWGIYSPLFEEMGLAAALWPDDLVFELLQAGTTKNGYDGVPFFSASHPEGGGVASNLQSGAGAPWYLMDTSRPLKPLIFQRRLIPEFQRQDRPDDPRVFMSDEYLYGVRARGEAGFGLWQMAWRSADTLNATNFDDAVEAMMSRKNDEGQSLKIRPNLLICGPSNRAAARALIEAERTASGASNTNFRAVDLMVTTLLP